MGPDRKNGELEKTVLPWPRGSRAMAPKYEFDDDVKTGKGDDVVALEENSHMNFVWGRFGNSNSLEDHHPYIKSRNGLIGN